MQTTLLARVVAALLVVQMWTIAAPAEIASTVSHNYYADAQTRSSYQLLEAAARNQFELGKFRPYLGLSYESYRDENYNYSIPAALLGADFQVFASALTFRAEYKHSLDKDFINLLKLGLFGGIYSQVTPHWKLSSYYELFSVQAKDFSYALGAAWLRFSRSLSVKFEPEAQIEVYVRESDPNSYIKEITEFRLGLGKYISQGQENTTLVRLYAYTDKNKDSGFTLQISTGGIL